MALIKQSNPAAAAARPFSMADIESHARKMLLQARQQADQLLAAAQAEAEAMKRQALEEGTAQGLAAGKREGLAQGKAEGVATGRKEAFEAEKTDLTELAAALAAALEQFDGGRRAMIEEAEAELLPLALSIARKVTKRMGAIDPRVVESNAREAVRLLATKHDVRIVLHPSQSQLMHSVVDRMKVQWPQLGHVTLVDDTSITPGGCRVHTAGGEIDAELDSQLDRLARELVPDIKGEPE
jgi:flagellar assembly protein FliH